MPPDDIDELRRKLTHAEAVIAELRSVVTDLRKQIDAQQAHIHRPVKITFGRGGERVEGPTLFDGLGPEPDPTPSPAAETPATEVNPPRRGRATAGGGSRRSCRAAGRRLGPWRRMGRPRSPH
jgi:hypothetical protein